MSNTAPPPPPPPQASSPSTPYGPPAGSPAKSGLPLWGKIAMGCGCLALIAAVLVVFGIGWGVKKVAESDAGASLGKAVEAAQALADNDLSRAAELAIEANPEFEVVENDPDNGVIRVRVKSSGEVGTIDYSQIQQGKFTFESDSGASFQVDGSETSDGVVTYTDNEGNTGRLGAGSDQDLPSFVLVYPGADTEEGGGYQHEQGDQISGLAGYTTANAFDDVVTWYEENLATAGYEVDRSSMSAGGSQMVSFTGKKPGVDQFTVAITQDGTEPVNIALHYSGPKE